MVTIPSLRLFIKYGVSLTFRGKMRLIFSFFLLLVSHSMNSQTLPSKVQDCEIQVTYQVEDASAGKSNGKIQILVDNQTPGEGYRIHVLNLGPARAEEPVRGGMLQGLKKGFYELIIVDLKRKCVEELTVFVEEI